ncbi:MAG: tRNA 2-thiouridine(34) synthase MnmA [Patescibacteria group bacterium]
MSTKQILSSISPTKGSPVGIRPRVFVGLSGGVDSAVSAALLKEQGYEVTGVFIKAWQPEWMECSWRDERRDAMKVCIALDIPFLFIDAEKEYKQGVVDKMLSEYKAGRTPNPDVLCNREIKFGIFWKEAKKHGADFIATGHYAQVREVRNKEYELREGKDKEKDQSYFLWTLTQEDLEHTLFPVEHMEKRDVRKLAQKFKLPVADKKDSQGICFLGDIGMEEFLSHYVTAKPGKVFNTDGEVIGKHKGLIYYTIGERHGFEITKKSPESGPFYIIAKDIETNSLVVSDNESEILEFSPTKILLKNVNWINEPEADELTARIRYRGEKLSCKLILNSKKLAVEFSQPVRGLSLGQSIVFYSGEECLGGAIMDKALS